MLKILLRNIHMTLLHKIAHLLGMQRGYPEAFYEKEKLMIKFVCATCGEISGEQEIDDIVDRELKK
jgi:hypothetical protein